METEITPILPDPRIHKRYYIEETLVRHAITVIADLALYGLSNRQVSGVEHLPERGPVVLAANHMTNFDVFPMQLALPRPIYFMGKAELFQNPLLDAFLRQMGGFPVYRRAHDAWAFEYAARVLKRGQLLGIFPEGTRSKGKGLGAAKTGAARLAIEADAPIVPLAINGTQQMFARFPHRTVISIQVGKPIYPQRDDSAQLLAEQVMRSIASMLPTDLRGAYAI